MSETGWAEVLTEHRVEESPAGRAARMARQAAGAQDRADALDEAERAAAIEDERDRRQMTYQQLGIAGRSTAQVFAEAGRIGDEDAEYAEAVKTIERINRRRAARAETMRFEAEQLALASRAQTPTDPLQAAQRRAHEAFRTATRAQISQASSGQPVSRPKEVSRSHGGAARSEYCVHCTGQGVSDEESYLLHSDPELNVPVTSPEQAREAEQAERRQYSSYAEIAR